MVVARMDHQDVAPLDLDACLLLPHLEVLGTVDVVVADSKLREVNDAGRADQCVNRNARDIRPRVVKVIRRIEMRGDMVGGGNMLRIHAFKGYLLDPLDSWPLVE